MPRPPPAHYEREDTVATVGRKGGALRLGIVDAAHGDADHDMEEESEQLPPEQVKVEWYPRGNVSVLRQQRLHLLDRSLLVGEPVRSLSDADRVGFVLGAEMHADMLLLPERTHVVANVDLSRMQFVSDLDPDTGTHLLYNGWIGEVNHATVRLELRHARGYRCSMLIHDNVDIEEVVRKPHSKLGGTYESDQWHVGQTVRVQAECIRSDAVWLAPKGVAPLRLRTQWRRDAGFDIKFVVDKVCYDSVEVTWRTCIDALAADHMHEMPSPVLNAAALAQCAKLDNYEYQTAQLGDRMNGALAEGDRLLTLQQWTADLRKAVHKALASATKAPAVRSPDDESITSYVSAASAPASELFVSASESMEALGGQLPSAAGHQESGGGAAVPLDSSSTQECSTAAAPLPPVPVPVRSSSCKLCSKSASKCDEDRSKEGGQAAAKTQTGKVGKAKRWNRGVRRAGSYKQALAQRKAAAAARRQQNAASRSDPTLPQVGDAYTGETMMHRSLLQVMWQDGTVQTGVPATALTYYDVDLDAHVFFPGALVQRSQDGELWPTGGGWGCVQSADNAQRLATVRWFLFDSADRSVANFITEEAVSTLDLKVHQDYELLTIATRVVRLSPPSADASVASSGASTVGQIVGCDPPSGRIEVKWCDGTQTLLYPTDVFQALPYDNEHDEEEEGSTTGSTGVPATTPPAADDSDWETASEESVLDMDTIDGIDPAALARQLRADDDGDNAGETASKRDKRSDEGDQAAEETADAGGEVETATGGAGEAGPLTHIVLVDASQHGCTPGTFEVLDCVPDEHHFRAAADLADVSNRHFWRAYKNEIKLLTSSLPSGIHVRGFADRMDLYSCIMEGPSGTPYMGGLFMFDVRLPQDYPNAPPLVHFKTYASESLNPNLYQDGKVCVSLLGTWQGKDSELWNPGSNLLQVFVSIQGLILNSEPYYNEAGYESRRGRADFAERSRRYNETATMRSLEALVNIGRRPPACFADYVRQHLRRVAEEVIEVAGGWMDGASTPEFPLLPISEGYKLSVRRQLDKLQQLYDTLDRAAEANE